MKLTTAETKLAGLLSDRHKRVRVYRGRAGGILLSRDAMYSSGREFFWVRLPNTPEARSARRRGYLVPR
jgi:hypothetical protein